MLFWYFLEVMKYMLLFSANLRQEVFEMNRKPQGMPGNMMHKETNAGVAMKNGLLILEHNLLRKILLEKSEKVSQANF